MRLLDESEDYEDSEVQAYDDGIKKSPQNNDYAEEFPEDFFHDNLKNENMEISSRTKYELEDYDELED